MGAKTSTANGTGGASGAGSSASQHHLHPQSPRNRTFSSSSSSADVVPGTSATGFNLLRAITAAPLNSSTSDRQRARSLSSVPDANGGPGSSSSAMNQQHHLNGTSGGMSIPPGAEMTLQQITTEENIAAATAGALALGRVYTATSLPSHIWSLNGKSHSFCKKFDLRKCNPRQSTAFNFNDFSMTTFRKNSITAEVFVSLFDFKSKTKSICAYWIAKCYNSSY